MARKAPKCKTGVSRKCGKACVSVKKNCRKDGRVTRTPGTKPDPKCTKGVTRKCGKACVSVRRNCKIDGTKGKAVPVNEYGRLHQVAARAHNLARRAPPNSAARRRLQNTALAALQKADELLPSEWIPMPVLSRGVTRGVI
jgi:hypothetical protein